MRLAWVAAAMVLPAMAQTPKEAGSPAFEVASVKPSAPGGRGGIIRPLPGNQTYVGNNVTLRLMMTVAYTVTDRQIDGGPEWINTDRFDMTAKAARPGTTDELHHMLQNLLEERFRLKLRREKRETAVWALVVDKGGVKMPEHDPKDLDHPPIGPNGQGGLAGRNVNMNYFAFMLSRILDRNVIDKTGLTVNYDLNLQFQPERAARPDGDDGGRLPEGPTIFTALREQLGLRLEATRGPVEYLVVESAVKPDGN